MKVFDDDDDGAVVNFFVFGSALAMSMHISGKSDQNIIVIVSNERLVAAIYLWNFSIQLNECEKHGAGLSRGKHSYNSVQPTNGHGTSLSLKYKCLLKDTNIYNWPTHPHTYHPHT